MSWLPALTPDWLREATGKVWAGLTHASTVTVRNAKIGWLRITRK